MIFTTDNNDNCSYALLFLCFRVCGKSHNSQTMSCVLWLGWHIDEVKKCLHSALFYTNHLIINRFRRVDTSALRLHHFCTMSALFGGVGQSVSCFGYSCNGDKTFLSEEQKNLAPITVVALWQIWRVQTAVQINNKVFYTHLYIDYQLFIL